MKIRRTGRLAALLLAAGLAFAGLVTTASATASPVAGVAHLVPNPCPGNSFSYQVNQPGARWRTKWVHKDVDICYEQAALLCRNVNLTPTTKWRRGKFRYRVNIWSTANCPTGYSACKGDINISKSVSGTTYFATIYLWPQCANKGRAGPQLTAFVKQAPERRRSVLGSGSNTYTLNGCSRPLRWREGYSVVDNIPFPYAEAEWTGNREGCDVALQTITRSNPSGRCPDGNTSGAVVRNDLWDLSSGIGNTRLCYGRWRARSTVSGSTWLGWHNMKVINRG